MSGVLSQLRIFTFVVSMRKTLQPTLVERLLAGKIVIVSFWATMAADGFLAPQCGKRREPYFKKVNYYRKLASPKDTAVVTDLLYDESNALLDLICVVDRSV